MPTDWTWNLYRCIARNGEWDDGEWVKYQLRVNNGRKAGKLYRLAFSPDLGRFADSPDFDAARKLEQWPRIREMIVVDAVEDAR